MRAIVAALVLVSIFAVSLLAQTDPQAPGKLIDVGGWRMHIKSAGTARAAQPTVILEAGSSDFSIEWAFVQPAMATFTRLLLLATTSTSTNLQIAGTEATSHCIWRQLLAIIESDCLNTRRRRTS